MVVLVINLVGIEARFKSVTWLKEEEKKDDKMEGFMKNCKRAMSESQTEALKSFLEIAIRRLV